MPVRFITDSCCDLPKEYVEQRNFTVIPLQFRVDEADYFDDFGASLSPKDFYAKLREGKTSSTSQIVAENFMSVFTPFLERGEDVFYLAFSSALSGTYDNATLAAKNLEEKFPGRRVYVVDSRAASLGQGLFMHHVLNKRDEGMPVEEIAQWALDNRDHICHWFTVFDLNHLKRGGRVSAASAFFGTMLSIKPVLHVDNAGALIPMEKVKGRAKSIQALFAHMKETVIEPQGHTVFISHGDNLPDAQLLGKMIQDEWGISDIMYNDIGPVIGSHSGPDTLALFFMGTTK